MGEVEEGQLRWAFMRGGMSNERGAFAECVHSSLVNYLSGHSTHMKHTQIHTSGMGYFVCRPFKHISRRSSVYPYSILDCSASILPQAWDP